MIDFNFFHFIIKIKTVEAGQFKIPQILFATRIQVTKHTVLFVLNDNDKNIPF